MQYCVSNEDYMVPSRKCEVCEKNTLDARGKFMVKITDENRMTEEVDFAEKMEEYLYA